MVDRGGREKAPRARALEVQTALAIEILLMVPIRIGNLVALDLERHIIRWRVGGAVHLAIPGPEVKNGFDIEAVLPARPFASLTSIYGNTAPAGRQAVHWLFPGQGQGHKGVTGFRSQITRCVKLECGLDVNHICFGTSRQNSSSMPTRALMAWFA